MDHVLSLNRGRKKDTKCKTGGLQRPKAVYRATAGSYGDTSKCQLGITDQLAFSVLLTLQPLACSCSGEYVRAKSPLSQLMRRSTYRSPLSAERKHNQLAYFLTAEGGVRPLGHWQTI